MFSWNRRRLACGVTSFLFKTLCRARGVLGRHRDTAALDLDRLDANFLEFGSRRFRFHGRHQSVQEIGQRRSICRLVPTFRFVVSAIRSGSDLLHYSDRKYVLLQTRGKAPAAFRK